LNPYIKIAAILLVFLFTFEKIKAQDTIKFIRVNYHFLLKNDNSGNFNQYWDGISDSTMNGYERAKLVIDKANYELAHNHKMFLPKPNNTEVIPSAMQYLLCGVYFNADDEFYTPDQHTGWAMLYKYGVNTKTEINIFNTPDDDLGSGIANNIASPLEQDLELAFKFKDLLNYIRYPSWSLTYSAGTVNHEMGHLLGLQHTWNENDDCDDTPQGKFVNGAFTQCWSYKENDSLCGNWNNCSNNIMDYNQFYPHAYTPCQLKKIHDVLNNSAVNYVAKMDKNAPPSAFFDIFANENKQKVVLEGRICANTVRYKIEIFDLGETDNPKAPKLVSAITNDAAIKQVQLSDFYFFKIENRYKIRLTTFSDSGEKAVMEKTMDKENVLLLKKS
jgi:hypothetical protein